MFPVILSISYTKDWSEYGKFQDVQKVNDLYFTFTKEL